MPVSFIDPTPTPPEAVEALEARLGSKLPDAYRDLLITVSNGGAVEPNSLQTANTVGVVALLGAGRDDQLDLEHRVAQYADHDRLPAGLIPVADAEGGNLVCISIRQADYGSVWFWDHELENTAAATSRLADDFARFLDDLTPISDADIPSAVAEAWIDPAFLEELGHDQN